MQGKRVGWAKHLDFIIIDIICIEVSLILALFTRYRNLTSYGYNQEFRLVNVLLLLIYVFLIFYQAIHSDILRRDYTKEVRQVIILNAELIAVLTVIFFVIKDSAAYSRLVIGLFTVYDVILMSICRCLRKYVLRKNFKNTDNPISVMVVAYRNEVEGLLEAFEHVENIYHVVTGIMLLDKDRSCTEVNGVPVVYWENIRDYAREHIIDEVYIRAKRGEISKLANRFISMGVIVHISMDKFLDELPNVSIETMGDYTIISTCISSLTPEQQVIKRGFDIIASIIGLVFTGLFFVIFGPIIYLQSPGPIIFKQDRVGKNGRIFKLYKFRSMKVNAEEEKAELMEKNEMQGNMFKLENDPRVIPIGRFLRKSSIDEFPQFWNVLKGDMSIVGTRPPTLDEYNKYNVHHMSRLAIKPGITGLWQVSGRSEITDFEEVVKLDNEYIRTFKIGLDVKILFQTVGAVLRQKGSK